MLPVSTFVSWLGSIADPSTLWGMLALGLSALAFGAVSTTNIRRTADEFVFTVIATADADTVTASIPHGMGVIPEVDILNILQAPAGLSEWAVTTQDVTNLVLTKSTAVGSGDAAAQVRVVVRRPR